MEIVQSTPQPTMFRLRDSFLEPYYRQKDPFQSLLARSTYLNKYSRGGEVWTDTIRRVVEGNMALTHGSSEREAEMLYHLFWTGQALPPGRGLWVGGVEGIPADARYNCFAKETRFWANGRLTTLEESVGQTVEVLCTDGNWRPAQVKSFGKQVLQTIRMAAPGRSKFAFEFTATPNHRWITSNRGTVEDLRVGDRVLITPNNVSAFRTTPDFKDGFAHGFLFGDGTKETQKTMTFAGHWISAIGAYKIRLCGEKDWKYKDLLKQASFFSSECSPSSYNGDPVLFFKSTFNLRRNLPNDDATFAYQTGFLEGWLAADGSWRTNGVGGNRLNSINVTAIEWAVERLPLLGYCATGQYTDFNEETNFGPRSAPLQVLTVRSEPVEYTVRSITDEGREEEVFCVVEPETHTFTLEGGVPTGNCWYTTLYSTEDWCWVMNMLMLGGGVGVGLGEIDRLPAVSQTPARFAIWCKSDHPDHGEVKPNDKHFLNGQTSVYVTPDSREGWVDSLRHMMRAAFEGRDLIIDVSPVRRRGLPIKTFGGTACGPGPLSHLLRSVWNIIRGAAERRLTSVEGLDITNMIGFCVKSGNVRRSALIALGDAEDQAFRDAKKDFEKVLSHRHTSNNSIIFRSWDQIRNFDWHRLIEDNLNFGEPGLFNLPLVWKTDPGAKGVNPCLTADSRVATQFGLIRIGDLHRMGQALKVTTDARVQADYIVNPTGRGVEVRDAVPAFKTSDAAEVFRVTTRHGYSLKATKYHKFPTPDGFLELGDLQVGSTLLLQSGEGQWGTEGSEDLGMIIGWLEGDGNFSAYDERDQKAIAQELLPICQKLAASIPAQNGREYTSERLHKALAEVGYREKGAVPEVIWRGTRDCVRGYIRALFATDGQVATSGPDTCSARLSQSNPSLLQDVQVLLGNFGIVSAIYKRRDAGWKRMPDGKGGMKDYWCEEQYELCISKSNLQNFAEQIGFMLDTQKITYESWMSNRKRTMQQEDYLDEIDSIESVGVEPVYCTTQPSHHTIVVQTIVSGQCGEQALHDHEACNLAENFPAQHASGTDSDISFRLLVRYCIRQRLTPLQDPVSHEVGLKNMRVGVALGGLCDFDWNDEQLAHWYRVCRKEADDYAGELRVNRPITVTTVKPSGTISLLNGSSPGIHAPFAPYYIRRARIAKNDPMVGALIEAGVTHEVDQYDKTGHTLVFAFPTKAAHTRITQETETIRDQFERQRAVQTNWADNAVSATLSFDKNTERDELAACLKEHVPHLKSTTVLSRSHGYVQAPYESIDESTYATMYSQIRHDHPLVRGGEFEMDECSSGVCPVR